MTTTARSLTLPPMPRSTQASEKPPAPGEMHLWYTLLTDIDSHRESSCESLLVADERERAARFSFPHDRALHVVSRALLRATLSRYASVDPRQWSFETGEHGKPYLARDTTGLQFNVSHTEGLAVVAVGTGNEVGVDVENVTRQSDFPALSRRFFAREEHEDVMRSSVEHMPETFFHYWTLKESYIKAKGGGLSIPLASFVFTPESIVPPAITFKNEVPNAARWQFHQIAIGNFRIAAATRCDSTLRVRVERTTPA